MQQKYEKNWKAERIDRITNTMKRLHALINFMITGITYMLPKGSDVIITSQYRHITCFQRIYKLITSFIANIINCHLEINDILSEEQKGCRRTHKGCKEQLIIYTTYKTSLHLSIINASIMTDEINIGNDIFQ